MGGGGARYQVTDWNEMRKTLGGGGGYCKLIQNLEVTSSTSVVIGTAGSENTNSGTISGSAGGATKFGSYSVKGGSAATSAKGGDGGCGAGINGLMGGTDGGDGSYGEYSLNGRNDVTTASSSFGIGGGRMNYTPRNPYDGEYYGVGGNGNAVFGNNKTWENSGTAGTAPTNYNAGRGGGYYAEPLPGICIIYGRPLGGEI